eukprot:948517_1
MSATKASLFKLRDTLEYNTKLVQNLQQQLKELKSRNTKAQDWRIVTKEYLLNIRNHIEGLRDRHIHLQNHNTCLKNTITNLNKDIDELTISRKPNCNNTSEDTTQIPTTIRKKHALHPTARPYKEYQIESLKQLMANSQKYRKRRLNLDNRIDNAHIHLRQVVKECVANSPDFYTTDIHQLKHALHEHLSRVCAVTNQWDTLRTLKLKITLENNSLRDTIKTLTDKQKGYKTSHVLRHGIDEYIDKGNKKMERTLAMAVKQRDEMYKQLEEERRAHQESRELVKKYKSKRDSLEILFGELRSCNEYNAETIEDEMSAERDALQRMCNELEKEERNTQLDEALYGICEAVLHSRPNVDRDQELWEQDFDGLYDVFDSKLKRKEVEWKSVKKESIEQDFDGLYDVFDSKLKRKEVEWKSVKKESIEQDFDGLYDVFDSKLKRKEVEWK